jgi:hypothetical protein
MILRALLLVASAAFGCAWPVPLPFSTALPEPPPEARLSVELIQGFTGRPVSAPAGPERVEVLIDVTSSMEAATEPGPGRHVAARQAAVRLVTALPRDSFVGLHALGVAGGDECSPAFRTGHSAAGEAREDLVGRIEELRPAGEASLAQALEGLRVYLTAMETLAHSRVVILSDFGEECGGDLCEELTRTVAEGARVELVVFGETRLPSCIVDFEIAGAWRVDAEARVMHFRVEAVATSADGVPSASAVGLVGGEPVAIAAGAARVFVGSDPPAEFGPVDLAPGTTTRLRILDFPALDPPVREWIWETEEETATRADGSIAADVP